MESGAFLGERYRIVRALGDGGMGAVYEAVDLSSERRVALKLVAEDVLANDPSVATRFQREARAMELLDHPHIARVLDAGVIDGKPFLAMELLEGADLRDTLARVGPLPPAAALRIAAAVCEGLAHAHAAGIVHRDVKPANLFLARGDGDEIAVKILDFGVAKWKMQHVALDSSDERTLTRTGSMLGTPLYMSPEQAQGEREIDARSDVWSLGVVLYEALSGKTPHDEAETVGRLILWICSRPTPPLQSLAPWIAPEVARVVHKALKLDPDARFLSAAAMLPAIRALLPDDRGLLATDLRALTEAERRHVAPSAAAAEDAPASSGIAGRGAARAPRRSRVVAASAILAGAGLATWRLVGAGSPSAAAPPLPVPDPPAATAEPAQPAEVLARLSVDPDARVWIDGAEVEVREGAIELRGRPGSKHALHLERAGRELTTEIVLTEDGVFPPRVGLEAPVARARSSAPTPAAPGPAVTGISPPPASSAKPLFGPAVKFE